MVSFLDRERSSTPGSQSSVGTPVGGSSSAAIPAKSPAGTGPPKRGRPKGSKTGMGRGAVAVTAQTKRPSPPRPPPPPVRIEPDYLIGVWDEWVFMGDADTAARCRRRRNGIFDGYRWIIIWLLYCTGCDVFTRRSLPRIHTKWVKHPTAFERSHFDVRTFRSLHARRTTLSLTLLQMAHPLTNLGDRSTDYLTTHYSNHPPPDDLKSSYDDLIDQYAEPYSRTSRHQTFKVQTPPIDDSESRGPSYSLDSKPPPPSGMSHDEAKDPPGAPQSYPPRTRHEKLDDHRKWWQHVSARPFSSQ